jgi:hypothetical protein
MNVFQTPQEIYGHLSPDFIAGQVEALARIERERVAREQVLRRPMAAAANPFVGQNQNAEYPAQRIAGQLRRVGVGASALAARIAVINRQIFAEEQPRQLIEAARRREEERSRCILM